MEAVVGSSALLSLIFELVYVPPYFWPYGAESGVAYKCLARCARVCKLWHNESCRFLWKHPHNLTSLLRLLNPDLSSSLNPAERRCYNASNISLSRFVHYSKWTCILNCLGGLKNSDDLKDAYLLAQLEGTALFPRLETLSFDGDFGASSTAALAFLSESLKSIDFDCSYTHVVFVLERLMFKSIQLNALVIQSLEEDPPSPDDRHCLTTVLAHQQSLKVLHLHPSWLDCDVFCAIGSLPGLTNLSVEHDTSCQGFTPRLVDTLYQDVVMKSSTQQGSCRWFPSLTNFTLAIHWFAGIKLLKAAVVGTKLRHLILWFQFREEDENRIDSRMIFLPSPPNGLAEVARIFVKVGDRYPLTPRLSAASLKPFSCSSLLQFLTVKTPRIPELDDNELLELIKNWPGLLELHFIDMWTIRRDDTCKFTLGLIAKIPAICHELSSLSLPVSYSGEALEAHHPQYQRLQSIHLGVSFFFDSDEPGWKDKVVLIAGYLAAVTPLSCAIDFSDFEGMDAHEEVVHHIPDEWDMLVEAHRHTKSSIRTHVRASRIAQSVAAALGDKGRCTLTPSQNYVDFSTI